VEPETALTQAVSDHYRCPEGFLDFDLSQELSSDEGYFRFGQDTTCYGRSSLGIRETRAESSLYDTLHGASVDDARVKLPFNPTEVIDNLRLERYAHGPGRGSVSNAILKRLYYALRPLTNSFMRKQVQKFQARNWGGKSFPRWPVDTTVENLCERLLLLSMKAKKVDEVPFIWFWPDGARGSVIMTHDVETEAGRDFCGKIMDMDDAFGIKASFQIIPEERYDVPAEFIESIRERGFEVAIQDLNHDGRLFDDKDQFLRRVAIINRYGTEHAAKGFRAAILYRRPEWYHNFEFSFDMSMPNVAPLDPQSGGCCTVMPFFIGDILELPVTTTQDYTLFYLLNERSLDLWKAQMELILKKHGMASFIIHPDYVMEEDTSSTYENLLRYLRNICDERNIWAGLPSEVDTWWRARREMSVVRDGNSWRIAGKDADRAVLAYARNVDGNLVYELANAVGAR